MLKRRSQAITTSYFSVGYFQIDFLYFQRNGIYHFEIKTTRTDKEVANHRSQLQRNRGFLRALSLTFCELIEEEENAGDLWDKNYFSQSSIFYQSFLISAKTIVATSSVEILGKEALERILLQENDSFPSKNLFKDKIYRNFLLFLAGFRPDYFISPVRCALFLQKNIFLNRVNTLNYYRKGDDGDKIQNIAKTVTVFLQELKFVRNVEIDFGEYKNIYLTPQQQEAVGFFDGGGNFFPERRLIFGPPGSGKSLILMLKIFILGQMETRNEKKVYYWSGSGEHQKKLTEFVSRNESKLCREVEDGWGEESIIASEGADVILDEESDGSVPLKCICSQHEDQMIALVCTGWRGNVTSRDYMDKYYSTDVKEFKSRGFLITELQTVFRSTRQIQSFFHQFRRDEDKGELISGHNFDGIKVEEWIFDGEEKLKKALDERIQRLIQIEGCEEGEIGLYQPWEYEKPQLINNIFYFY